MLLDPRTPIIIGTLLIALLVGSLAVYSPAPGHLSSPHAQIEGLMELEGCTTCHDEAGTTQGCLGCHEEIAAQLTSKAGFHHVLMTAAGESGSGRRECGDCHTEHFGEDFHLINQTSWGAQSPEAFRHPHVDFALKGKHERLPCENCHEAHRDGPFRLPAFPSFERRRTFLGLDQDCIACHEDIHSGGLSGPCDDCHGQETFQPPAHFDHAEKFPLEGGHAGLECKRCHVIPEPGTARKPFPFPFDEVAGTACDECHESPHLAAFPEKCSACHAVSEPLWTAAALAMTTVRHDATGFRLDGPHEGVPCVKCHEPGLSFRERHPDPSAPGYRRQEESCEGCHPDVHAGQFAAITTKCRDCHDRGRFLPSLFGHRAHAEVYPLTGAHAAVPCLSCHPADEATGVRRFVGTTHACRECHDSPHGDQFVDEIASGDCKTCHSTEAFRIRPFDHERRTGYRLEGAHAGAECNGCHIEIAQPDGARVRRFTGTPTECSACHIDVHRGQFGDRSTRCTDCHVSPHRWSDLQFDHDRQSSFPLEGAHRRVECSRCHLPVNLQDGTVFVRYKPLGTTCGSCHEVRSRLQLRRSR